MGKPNKRKSLSKKQRFDIFKRDDFVCQYCGGKPPSVVLEVDHVVPVVEGGCNDDHNLITACFDCNRGKGKEGLEVSPVDIDSRLAQIEEKKLQVKAYERVLASEKRKKEKLINKIVDIYDGSFEKWSLTDSAKVSIGRFLDRLPPTIVIDAMEISCAKMDSERCFKYFCGICWRRIKEG